MVALFVPQKKWVESAVNEIDVTDPITFASFLTSKSWELTFASVPSPEPNRRSPFDNNLMQFIPWEKSFFIGPILLNKLFFNEISQMSPVLVPR